MEWLTRPDPEYEVPNIDWIIVVFTGTKEYNGKPYPSIKSWVQPVVAINDLLKKRCKLKGALFFIYCWPNVLKEFSIGSEYKEWKYDKVIIHNTYHGGNIETDHHVI